MREPSLRTSRLAIAGGFAGVIGIAMGGFLLGRSTSPEPAPSAPLPVASEAVPIAQTPRTLSRSDIIAFGDRTADAFASGKILPQIDDLSGRRFDLVLPFGCEGPAAQDSDAPLRWNYDAAQETLRVRVAATRWTLEEWGGRQPAGTPPQVLEGFWVSRPWSSAERCPASSAQSSSLARAGAIPAVQTLAVAEVRTLDERRERKGGPRPHEIVTRLPEESLGSVSGLNLRLSGRLERLEGGGARCVQRGAAEQRPACVVAVSIDEVRIENPSSGETLGTWSPRPAESVPE